MEANQQDVFKTYDQISDWFFANRDQGLMEKPYLDRLIEIMSPNASVLDLGCGTGIPMMSYLLAKGIQVTGVDGSYRMLEMAKTNFPEVSFIKADMRKLELHNKFNAIIAWHSFFHLPAADQPQMFVIFRDHLHKNGILMFTSGMENGEAWSECGGEQLYHASLDKSAYHELLLQNSFRVLSYTASDPNCGGATVWIAQLCETT